MKTLILNILVSLLANDDYQIREAGYNHLVTLNNNFDFRAEIQMHISVAADAEVKRSLQCIISEYYNVSPVSFTQINNKLYTGLNFTPTDINVINDIFWKYYSYRNQISDDDSETIYSDAWQFEMGNAVITYLFQTGRTRTDVLKVITIATSK